MTFTVPPNFLSGFRELNENGSISASFYNFREKFPVQKVKLDSREHSLISFLCGILLLFIKQSSGQLIKGQKTTSRTFCFNFMIK